MDWLLDAQSNGGALIFAHVAMTSYLDVDRLKCSRSEIIYLHTYRWNWTVTLIQFKRAQFPFKWAQVDRKTKPKSEAGVSAMFSRGLMDRRRLFRLYSIWNMDLLLSQKRALSSTFTFRGEEHAKVPLESGTSETDIGIVRSTPCSNAGCRLCSWNNADWHRLTTHLIRRGSLTIIYPRDPSPTMETFGVGGRVDVPAGKVHEVWMGSEGCEYVIGEWLCRLHTMMHEFYL